MTVLNQIGATVGNLLARAEPLPADTYIEPVDSIPVRVKEIHVPAHPPNERLPLLIGLHGYGSDQHQIATLVNVQLDAQLDEPYIYIAPRAPHVHPTGGFAWFPIDIAGGEINFDVDELQRSLDLIAALILRSLERYDADPERVYLVGYSQGAAMSTAFALVYPELIAGAVAMSGSLQDEVKPLAADAEYLHGKPFFLGYGTRDPLLTPTDMEDTQRFLRERGVDVTYREYAIPHVVSQAELRDVEAWLGSVIES